MKKSRAFIGIIVLIIIAILLLSYFGFDLKKIFTSEAVKNNFSYVWGIIKNIWSDYLARPWNFIWDNAFKPLFSLMWSAFLAGLEGIKAANN
jgi:hypothetical protein